MEALLSSFLLVGLGEIGDKTQLLSLALILKFRKPWPILAGVLVATLLNHGVSVWFGDWLAGAIPADWLRWILGISFIGLGLWMLIPDDDEKVDDDPRFGPFLTALVLFGWVVWGVFRPAARERYRVAMQSLTHANVDLVKLPRRPRSDQA